MIIFTRRTLKEKEGLKIDQNHHLFKTIHYDMITSTAVDHATTLRRRIADLKNRVVGERTELRTTVQELRNQLTPTAIAKRVVGSLLNQHQTVPTIQDGLTTLAWQLPLRLLTNVLVRDPRAAFLIKTVAPVAMHFAPKILEKANVSLPTRIKVYGLLRKKVIKLRSRFRVVEEDASWFI